MPNSTGILRFAALPVPVPVLALVLVCVFLLDDVQYLRSATAFVAMTHRPRINAASSTSYTSSSSTSSTTSSSLADMKRPFLDRIASTLFRLETDRVERASVVDDKGRTGEPMEWSEPDSPANAFSKMVAGNPLGYRFKQFVADVVAGDDYDREASLKTVDEFVESHPVAVFSFATCPFCRRAKDLLDEKGIPYGVIELDELEGNRGNELRATLGRKTGRTSVPSIFVGGTFIGGCNDGPGLLPLEESGELDRLLNEVLP